MPKVGIVNQKEPWGRFFVKLLATTLVMACGAAYALARYDFGEDSQENRCLHPYKLFAIDRWDKDLAPGDYVAFHAAGMGPFFADGEVVIKQVVAVAGDEIEVKDGQVFINGVFKYGGFQEAGLKGRPLESFNRKRVLQDGEYFVYAWHSLSYDSRYWGTVKSHQIVGETHALM
jgi:conjugal transfer pilin signal peptidase TrbI